MKIPRAWLLLVFLLGFLGQGGSALWALSTNDTAQFNQANSLYRDGKFSEAAKIYGALAENAPSEAVLFYDLGNALHRNGELGKAILAYERALQINPRHSDAQYNLRYIRSLLEYRIQDKRSWYLKAAETALNFFTQKEIGFIFLLSYFLLIVSLCYSHFLKRDFTWGWKRQTLAFFSFLFLAVFLVKTGQIKMFRDAIITVKEAQVRYGPSYTDQLAFRLGEGLKVHVVDSREGWSRVYLTNGETGWIAKDQVTEVRG